MTLLKLRYYPDPVLETPGDLVEEFDDDFRKLVENMFSTMYATHGVGLAAPQVGISKRLFVMDCSVDKEPSRKIVVANPEVVFVGGDQNGQEGCLSFPGYYMQVKRPLRAIVRGQDINGKEFEYEGVGLEARCIMHETDHCDGIVFINRATPLKRQWVKRSINKLIKANEWY